MVRRLGRRHQPRNLLFLCGWYRRALAGWHRLASGLVRLRKDTRCLRSIAIAGPESVGKVLGCARLIVYVSATFMDPRTPSVSLISGTPEGSGRRK
jgi:hypothetical protein